MENNTIPIAILILAFAYLGLLALLIHAGKVQRKDQCADIQLVGHDYVTCFGAGDGTFHRWGCGACRNGGAK